MLIRRGIYTPSCSETPLLQEVFNNTEASLKYGEYYIINRLILIYSGKIEIDIQDTITLNIGGRIPIFLYLAHANPFLSMFLKGGLEIPCDIKLDTLVLYKFSFPPKFQVFISGKCFTNIY
jgi:hypothetical protein